MWLAGTRFNSEQSVYLWRLICYTCVESQPIHAHTHARTRLRPIRVRSLARPMHVNAKETSEQAKEKKMKKRVFQRV